MQLKGVLLDIDGTLVDSNDAHAEAWVKAFAKHAIQVSFESVRRLIGKGGDKLLPEVSGIPLESVQGKAISEDRQAIFQNEYLPNLRPFPKVAELLDRMKNDGLKLGVATSAKENELDGLLTICGAREFLDAQTSSDDAENSKPDPDIVKVALKKVRLKPLEALLLGDTPYDIEAAQGAGVAIIALRCGGWKDAELKGAKAIYDDPADLLVQYDRSPLCRAHS